MKRALGLALLLTFSSALSACSDESVAAAKKAADTTIEGLAKGANLLAEKVSELDLSALSPEALQEHASHVLTWSAEQLDQVKDSETAARVAEAVEEVLDAAGELLRAAAAELPNKAEVREHIEQVRVRHGGDSAVMEALDPVLARLSALLE